MPKKYIQEIKQPEPEEPKKRTRKMTPEMLEKLRLAREKALEARKMSKGVNEELVQIRSEIKKEKLGDRVNEIETYKKLKERVDDEVKKNEIVLINKKLEDMYSRFDGFLQDREREKMEKEQRRNEKKAKEIVQELPMALSQKMLEEEIKRQELARFRKRHFGI